MIIGLLGGMGTYATIDLFRKYAELFPAEKEWDRPRLIIDNNCVMPSRVRAVLYQEKRQELVAAMTASLEMMADAGCTHILLGCNTSHIFLPEVFERRPALKPLVVDLLAVCTERLVRDGVTDVSILATEGTLDSGIYHRYLDPHGIRLHEPDKAMFPLLRDCIECVKQNADPAAVKPAFDRLLAGSVDPCILGCTELPVLYDRLYPGHATGPRVIDPGRLALEKLREAFLSGR